MKLPESRIPASRQHKEEALERVYSVYLEWVSRFPLACRKGCSACCTRSVTMTSLEGERILDFLRSSGRDIWLQETLAGTGRGRSDPMLSMNRFARACLEKRETDPADQEEWDLAPCIFLQEGNCSIYEVRPFGCRCFGSISRCEPGKAATVLPVHLTVNTVFTQITEHLSSDGGGWGRIEDILKSLTGKQEQTAASGLQSAEPVPGFLLDPLEKKLIRKLLEQLQAVSAKKETFSDLIDNFISI